MGQTPLPTRHCCVQLRQQPLEGLPLGPSRSPCRSPAVGVTQALYRRVQPPAESRLALHMTPCNTHIAKMGTLQQQANGATRCLTASQSSGINKQHHLMPEKLLMLLLASRLTCAWTRAARCVVQLVDAPCDERPRPPMQHTRLSKDCCCLHVPHLCVVPCSSRTSLEPAA